MRQPTREGSRYRAVLSHREFRGIFLADALSVLGDQVARIAIALLVFARTGSAFASAATYAASYLTSLLSGPLLSPLADRYRRRELMIGCDLVRFALLAALCLPGLPLWCFFAAIVGVALVTTPFEAARSALLADVLQGEDYVAANALTNAFSQVGQVMGFLLGGALVAIVGERGALGVDAATFALSALLLAASLRRRSRPEADPLPLSAELLAGARLVFADRRLWTMLATSMAAAAALIVPESLAVAVAADLGGGAVAAGLLTASLPAGFILGSAVVLRLTSGDRLNLLSPLLLLSTIPLLATPLVSSWPAVAALWLLAGTGAALQLVANAAFIAAVPSALRGRAYGVASSALMGAQGAAVLVAGALSGRVGSEVPVALVAAAAIVAVVVLPRPGRGAPRHAVKE